MPIPRNKLPVPRYVLADAVTERLFDDIMTGRRAPGAPVSETEAAAAYGVSRGPIREAIGKVTAIGLISSAFGRGVHVTPLSPRRHRETLHTLGPVVAHSIRFLVELTDDDHDRAHLADAFASADSVALPERLAVGGPFEEAMLLLGNRRIMTSWEALTAFVRRTWALSVDALPDAVPTAELTAFAVAIRARDPQAVFAGISAWFDAAAEFLPNLPEETPQPVREQDGTRREHAFRLIYRAIYDGTLLPGEELPEQELSHWLDMSRQPIREALADLAGYSLVTLTRGRPPMVTPFDHARTNQTLLLSSFFNEHGVAHTTATLTDEDRAALNRHRDTIHAAAAASQYAELALALDGFFSVFTSALHNTVLEERKRRIVTELALLLRPGSSRTDITTLPPGIDRINDAAQARDTASAVHHTHDFYALTRSNFATHFRQKDPRAER